MKVLEATGVDGLSKKVKITIWDTGMIHNTYLSLKSFRFIALN